MKRKMQKVLCALIVFILVISAVNFNGLALVNADVSSDIMKFTEIIMKEDLSTRQAVVGIIATGSAGNYTFKSSMTDSEISAAATNIRSIVLNDDTTLLGSKISQTTLVNALKNMRTYYNTNTGYASYVNYALNKFASPLQPIVGVHTNDLTNTIAAKTFSYEIFLNFLIDIKDMTGLKPLYYYTDSKTIAINESLEALANVIKNLSGFSQSARFDTYKSTLNGYIADVNAWSNTTEKEEFIADLNKYGLYESKTQQTSGGIIIPPVIPPTTPADSVVSAKPELDTKTGVAKSTIATDAINTALNKAAANSDGKKEVVVEVAAVAGAKEYVTALPASVLKAAEASHEIKVATEFGAVELPANILTNASIAQSSTVELVIAKVDTSALDNSIKQHIGNRPVVDLNLKADGNIIKWNNPDTPVTVAVKYTPTAEELNNHEFIVVWYIDDNGKITPVTNGKYDAASGNVVFSVHHFSKYAVAYYKKTFTDLAKYAWAKKQIEVMASKGIINGTSESTYNPSANITRGDFIKLLINTLGLTAKYDTCFSDVNTSDYYYHEIAVAKKLGIATGIGDNMFAPKQTITRQDMMVLIDRAMKIAKKSKTVGTDSELAPFADKSKIASYARSSVATMIKDGIVVGDGKNINPRGNATRAEVAVMMYRIYNK